MPSKWSLFLTSSAKPCLDRPQVHVTFLLDGKSPWVMHETDDGIVFPASRRSIWVWRLSNVCAEPEKSPNACTHLQISAGKCPAGHCSRKKQKHTRACTARLVQHAWSGAQKMSAAESRSRWTWRHRKTDQSDVRHHHCCRPHSRWAVLRIALCLRFWFGTDSACHILRYKRCLLRLWLTSKN